MTDQEAGSQATGRPRWHDPEEIAGEVTAYVVVEGDFDPAVFTERLGIQPDRVHRAGDPKPVGTSHYRSDFWLLKTAKEADGEPDEHILEVLHRLEPASTDFRELVAEMGLQSRLYLVVYTYMGTFPFVIEQETMAQLVQLDLPLNVDLFPRGSNQETAARTES